MEMMCKSGGRTAGVSIIFAIVGAKRSISMPTLIAVLGTAAQYYITVLGAAGPLTLTTESTADSRWGSL